MALVRHAKVVLPQRKHIRDDAGLMQLCAQDAMADALVLGTDVKTRNVWVLVAQSLDESHSSLGLGYRLTIARSGDRR